MKKSIKILIIILITFFISLCFFQTKVIADVGSFESYDSGSSWDTDWDSGSSWDTDWDSGSSSSSSSVFDIAWLIYLAIEHPFIFLIVVVIIIISNIMKKKNKNNSQFIRNNAFYNRNRPRQTQNYQVQNMQALETRQTQIENQIQSHDENFNKEEFVAWSKNLFIKLQNAWTARDWDTIRAFETESLFEQHRNQLQGYISNNQINVMDRICVNYAHLYAYRQEGDKEVLTVRLNSRMQDYIIDATTKELIKGDKDLDIYNTYLLTFIRKNGVKTKPGTIEVNTTNCPNCGAPTQITSSGKCEYCGSVMTTGEYNWVLSNLQRENVRM